MKKHITTNRFINIKRLLTFILSIVIATNLYGTTVAYSAAKVYDSKKEVEAEIRKNLLKHKGEINIEITTKLFNSIDNMLDLINGALAIDKANTFKDGAYLTGLVTSNNINYQYGGTLKNVSVKIITKFRTTKKQETTLDNKLASVIEKLNLSKKTDEQKIKSIHDYIIKRVDYDYKLKKYSAYDALINKSAVCQGYAMLAYRMFNEAGIECKYITGYRSSTGELHAWNIVKLDDKWYNMDLTWDDPIINGEVGNLVYTYYLKSEADFTDHTRDSKYNTKAFNKKYKMAKSSYLIDK